MRRSASEIIRDLEIRIARLEKQANSKQASKYTMLDPDSEGYPLQQGVFPSMMLRLPDGHQSAGSGKDWISGYSDSKPTQVLVEEGDLVIIFGTEKGREVISAVENFANANPHIMLERDVKNPLYRSGRISFADFILSTSDLKDLAPLVKQLTRIKGVKFDLTNNAKRALGVRVARLEKQSFKFPRKPKPNTLTLVESEEGFHRFEVSGNATITLDDIEGLAKTLFVYRPSSQWYRQELDEKALIYSDGEYTTIGSYGHAFRNLFSKIIKKQVLISKNRSGDKITVSFNAQGLYRSLRMIYSEGLHFLLNRKLVDKGAGVIGKLLDDAIRSLGSEIRVARLENRNAGVSRSEIAKVRGIILKALLNSTPKQEKWGEDYEGDRYGSEYNAGGALEYRVPLRLICKLVSKALGKEVSRTDLEPFIDDLFDYLPEKMEFEDSSITDVAEFLNIDLELDGIDHIYALDSARVETEVEIDDTHRDSDDYLIVYYYIRASRMEGP